MPRRDALEDARIAANISVTEICEQLGVSGDAWYKWVRGERTPRGKAMRTVSDILGKSVDELFFAQALDGMSKITPKSA